MTNSKNPFQHRHTQIDRGRLLVDNDLEPRTLAITPEGYLQIAVATVEGVISTGNSVNITNKLLAGQTFIGEWEEIVDCATIRSFVYSDKSASAKGLIFQQSPDKELISDDKYNYEGGNEKLYCINPVPQYFRIVFINGPEDQTNFSIQTIYSSVYSKPTSHRLGDNVTGDDDSELTKTVIAYRNEVDDTYNNVGAQAPLPVDGDSVYTKDIWINESDIGDFTGSITDLFDNLHSFITNTTSANPKEILIHFNRTIISNVIGFGSYSDNFSNTEIFILVSGDVEIQVVDESSSNTKYTSRTFQLPITAGYNGIRIKFHTTDTVTLSNIVLPKIRGVVARLQAVKPDGIVTDINATQGANLKVSMEELESQISSNNNSQLNTTLFSAAGNELCLDEFTGAMCSIDYPHHEIHAGNHFYNKDWIDLANGVTYDILLSVADTTKWPHFLFILNAEAEFNIIFYAEVTASNNGTPLLVNNRNGNSLTANGLLAYHTPTITDLGIQIARYKGGSGKSVGGAVRANNESLLTQNTKFLARIHNDTTSNNWIDWLLDWYEHTNKVV